MTPPTQPTKRYFTDAARAAALAVRQAKALLPKGGALQVFIVRGTNGGASFTWNIRRFGGVTVEYGDDTFATQAEALAAGRRALALQVGSVPPADTSSVGVPVHVAL